ncbi:MAG: hypothetical protein JSS63_02260 [Bacteroidetes bacterium]|nr:hypothetical protein [Bacteroidota bacterium]
MQKIFLSFILLVLLYSNIYAQEKERQNSLEAGKWALQFTIDQNFTLSNFEGSIASVKKQFSPRSALRLGLSLDFGRSNSKENDFIYNDTLNPQYSKRFYFSAFIYPTYLIYVNPNSPVNLYFGGGFTLGGSYRWHESEQSEEEGSYYAWEKTYSYGGGITGTVGVEFFPIKNFSILAEYFVSLQYANEVSSTVYTSPSNYQKREVTSDYVEFFGKRVNFGLAVYF